MVCDKCGSSEVDVRRDSRGLPVAYCKNCGQQIKRLTTVELADLYDEVRQRASENTEQDDRLPCPYCTERYIMLRGNERTRVFQVPFIAKYCPICGRKLREEDKAY